LQGANLNNVIAPIPRQQAQTKAENSISIARDIMQESTGVTEQVQGLLPDKNMTKGEKLGKDFLVSMTSCEITHDFK
jgi:hypothetical protein